MDIRGLEVWENDAKGWAKNAGRLKIKAGIGIVDALEYWYSQWQTKRTKRNKKEYMTWRLRLHLRHNHEPEFLEELDETFKIGLFDETIGQTFWHLEPEVSSSLRAGFNWRKDSGEALRGRTLRREEG